MEARQNQFDIPLAQPYNSPAACSFELRSMLMSKLHAAREYPSCRGSMHPMQDACS